MSTVPVLVGLDYSLTGVQVCVLDREGRMLGNQKVLDRPTLLSQQKVPPSALGVAQSPKASGGTRSRQPAWPKLPARWRDDPEYNHGLSDCKQKDEQSLSMRATPAPKAAETPTRLATLPWRYSRKPDDSTAGRIGPAMLPPIVSWGKKPLPVR
jgi:hypothetical protein